MWWVQVLASVVGLLDINKKIALHHHETLHARAHHKMLHAHAHQEMVHAHAHQEMLRDRAHHAHLLHVTVALLLQDAGQQHKTVFLRLLRVQGRMWILVFQTDREIHATTTIAPGFAIHVARRDTCGLIVLRTKKLFGPDSPLGVDGTTQIGRGHMLHRVVVSILLHPEVQGGLIHLAAPAMVQMHRGRIIEYR